MRLWLALLVVFEAVSPVMAQSPAELRDYLADAVRLAGDCKTVKLDEGVARQIAALAGIADANAQMRTLGEQQLALSDTVKPPVPPSPAPNLPDGEAKPLPPAGVRPKPVPTPCQQALSLYGPTGTRLAGLIVLKR